MIEALITAYLVFLVIVGACLAIFARSVIDRSDIIEEKLARAFDKLLAKPFLQSYVVESARKFRETGMYNVTVWIFRFLGLAAVVTGTYFMLIQLNLL